MTASPASAEHKHKSSDSPLPSDPVESTLAEAGELVAQCLALDEVWHPGEAAWRLHTLTADSGLLDRLHHALEQAAHWCAQDINGRPIATDLRSAAQQLSTVRDTVTQQVSALHHLAALPPAPAPASSRALPPPSPHNAPAPRRR